MEQKRAWLPPPATTQTLTHGIGVGVWVHVEVDEIECDGVRVGVPVMEGVAEDDEERVWVSVEVGVCVKVMVGVAVVVGVAVELGVGVSVVVGVAERDEEGDSVPVRESVTVVVGV